MTRHLGIPFSGFTPEERNQFTIIISDVDAILSADGKLCPSALSALWNLKKSGRTIVLLTEGSSSTAETYLREWPVDAVQAENGALLVSHGKDNTITHLTNPAINRNKVLLKRINLMNMTKGLSFASDQQGRTFDVAYDKSKLTMEERKILKNTFLSLGAKSLETKTHINAWFGDYDRRSALKHFLQGPLSLKEEYYLEHTLYIGASSEDSQLFDYFLTSVGIQDVLQNRSEKSVLPTYITDGGPNEGFCEVSKALLGV